MWYELSKIKEHREFLKSFVGVVYIIRCKENGKCYVGQTKRDAYSRFRSHTHEAFVKNSKFAVHNALRKHGVEAFEVSILATGIQAEDERHVLEVASIVEHHSFTSDGGYNMTRGGEGAREHVKSEETCKLLSAKRKGVPMPLWARDNLKKPVLQIDKKTGQIIRTFLSISDAATMVGAPVGNITKALQGKTKSCAGFAWKYMNEDADAAKGRWSEEKKIHRKSLNLGVKKYKIVQQIDLKTKKVIATFPSVKEAHKVTGIAMIEAVACGIRKSAGGFFWRYVVDVI